MTVVQVIKQNLKKQLVLKDLFGILLLLSHAVLSVLLLLRGRKKIFLGSSCTLHLGNVWISHLFSLLSGIRAYEQLGFRAFGTPGKMAAGIAITLQNIGGETLSNVMFQETQCIAL